MSPSQERLHAIVSGLVQGVNYRSNTRGHALMRGLTGWVRNRADGSVEVVAEGPREVLADFLQYLRQGPRAAVVEDVRETWGPATGEFRQFEIRP
jgi:acylphosphatase